MKKQYHESLSALKERKIELFEEMKSLFGNLFSGNTKLANKAKKRCKQIKLEVLLIDDKIPKIEKRIQELKEELNELE